MTVGLPGVGIGGLFYLISALLMPVHESIRRARGSSGPGRWRLVATQWLLAAGIVAALWGTGWILGRTITVVAGRAGAVAAPSVTGNVIAVSALGLSLGTLALVLLGVQVLRVVLGSRGALSPPDVCPAGAMLTRGTTDSRADVGRFDPSSNGRGGDASPLRRRSLGRSPEAG